MLDTMWVYSGGSDIHVTSCIIAGSFRVSLLGTEVRCWGLGSGAQTETLVVVEMLGHLGLATWVQSVLGWKKWTNVWTVIECSEICSFNYDTWENALLSGLSDKNETHITLLYKSKCPKGTWIRILKTVLWRAEVVYFSKMTKCVKVSNTWTMKEVNKNNLRFTHIERPILISYKRCRPLKLAKKILGTFWGFLMTIVRVLYQNRLTMGFNNEQSYRTSKNW